MSSANNLLNTAVVVYRGALHSVVKKTRRLSRNDEMRILGLTTRMNPLMSSAEDLFSSSRVRALPSREKVIYETLTSSGRAQQSLEVTRVTLSRTHTDALLDGVVHGLADVHHGVEDDRVSGWLRLVSARDKRLTKAFVLIFFSFQLLFLRGPTL